MNAKTFAKTFGMASRACGEVLKGAGYAFDYDKWSWVKDGASLFDGSGMTWALTTYNAYAKFIEAQEALEADTQQTANDLAGKTAYNEVKAEASEYTVKTEPFRDSTISFVKAPDGTSITVGIKTDNAETLVDILNSETEDLRQQLADAQAENARLTSAMNKAVSHLDFVTLHNCHAAQQILKRALAGEEFSHIGIEAPTPPAPESVTLDKPKFLVGDKVRVKNSYTSYHGMIGEVEDVNVWRNRREYGVRFETVKGVRELLEAELEPYKAQAVQS